jgi:Streptomyces sporulation and cell division protein, SsgA
MNGANVRGWTVADQLVAGEPAQVTVELGWRESDPYTVEVLFLVGEDGSEDVPWLLARDLLAQGLHSPSGIGDIHIRPGGSCECCGDDITVIKLTAPSGWAEFGFSTADLSQFLEATYDQCPPGAESLVFDLDTEIALLLEGGNR